MKVLWKILAPNKNLGIVNYIVKSQIFFRTSGANLNLHNFVKIYSLFLFDDGTVDQVAIDILSTVLYVRRLVLKLFGARLFYSF